MLHFRTAAVLGAPQTDAARWGADRRVNLTHQGPATPSSPQAATPSGLAVDRQPLRDSTGRRGRPATHRGVGSPSDLRTAAWEQAYSRGCRTGGFSGGRTPLPLHLTR